MYLIQQITDDPLQKQTLILPNGISLSLTISFAPMQYCWFVVSLVYGSFTLNGLQITNSPNMLHQFKNQIPFGLACFSTNNREPSQQEDFASGASQLYLLSAAEVAQYAGLLQNG
jgi:hypothetical protein